MRAQKRSHDPSTARPYAPGAINRNNPGATMRRRDFTATLLGGAATLGIWPLSARAQQSSVPVVGFLRMTSAANSAHLAAAFRLGLKEAGFTEGQNVAIEYRYAENRRERAPALAAELVGRNVAVIATDQAVREVKATTSTTPILFVLGADPVAAGLVASLNRPGANVTGIVVLLCPTGGQTHRTAAPVGTHSDDDRRPGISDKSRRQDRAKSG